LKKLEQLCLARLRKAMLAKRERGLGETRGERREDPILAFALFQRCLSVKESHRTRMHRFRERTALLLCSYTSSTVSKPSSESRSSVVWLTLLFSPSLPHPARDKSQQDHYSIPPISLH
jgi:hypothetical protein